MATNKVVINGETKIDLTADTVTPETLAFGVTAHDASGNLITGTNEGMNVTPVGTVIYYAGKAAPSGYLACDGTVYNIADYPDLAAFFQTNYGSKNYWGGDGETTFAVPDWQGEFFRAAGTNSRENQGSGADVGVHQDGTIHPDIVPANQNKNLEAVPSFDVLKDYDVGLYPGTPWYANSSLFLGEDDWTMYAGYIARPTNTSLLVCIKAV